MLGGGLLGSLADIQKHTFETAKRNEGKVLDKGLWGLSRHPNYLGEIIFWWGAFLVNFSAGILWTVVCPIALTFMILFVTGIPPSERLMKEELAEKYVDYAKRVPILIPFFGAHAKMDKGSIEGTGRAQEKQREGNVGGNVNRQSQQETIRT